ncbi:MAG: hypothetical protein NT060_00405 [Candidatus Omnitrophica bacterium]|nr:hypothetical protein [Candidatus Omnitrophota bacterium]
MSAQKELGFVLVADMGDDALKKGVGVEHAKSYVGPYEHINKIAGRQVWEVSRASWREGKEKPHIRIYSDSLKLLIDSQRPSAFYEVSDGVLKQKLIGPGNY